MPHTGIILIDVQDGFITPKTAHIPPLVQAVQAEYELVIATQFVNPPLSSFRRLMKWERFSEGSPETALAFARASHTQVVVKSTYTALTPAVVGILESSGVEEVHLCGLETDICVLKSAVDIFEYGLRPVVLKSLCATRAGPGIHDAALAILARYIGAEQIR